MGSGSDERGTHRKRKADTRSSSRPQKRHAPATAEAATTKEASRAAIKRLVSSFDALTSHSGDANTAAEAYQQVLAAATGEHACCQHPL